MKTKLLLVIFATTFLPVLSLRAQTTEPDDPQQLSFVLKNKTQLTDFEDLIQLIQSTIPTYIDLSRRIEALEKQAGSAAKTGAPSAGGTSSDLYERLDALERRMKSYTPSSSTKDVSTCMERIDQLESWLNGVVGSSTGYHYWGTNLSRLSEKLEALESKVNSLTGSSYSTPNLSDLSNSIERLEREIRDLKSDVSDLEYKIR